MEKTRLGIAAETIEALAQSNGEAVKLLPQADYLRRLDQVVRAFMQEQGKRSATITLIDLLTVMKENSNV